MTKLRWKKINDYCIELNEITITKAKVINETKYVLWQNGNLIKVFKTSDEAKNEAMALIQAKPALFNKSIN